ncbi:MAG: hypothetical protein SGPRY_008494 [Prymnesium sp.]
MALRAAGANEAVIEADELPRSAPLLLRGGEPLRSLVRRVPAKISLEARSAEIGKLTSSEAARFLELYKSMGTDGDGVIAESVLAATLLKSAPGGMLSDAAAQEVGRLAAAATSAPVENHDGARLDFIEFCRIAKLTGILEAESRGSE